MSESARARLMRESAALGWDAAVAAMRYEDGTPIEIRESINPYRRSDDESATVEEFLSADFIIPSTGGGLGRRVMEEAPLTRQDILDALTDHGSVFPLADEALARYEARIWDEGRRYVEMFRGKLEYEADNPYRPTPGTR